MANQKTQGTTNDVDPAVVDRVVLLPDLDHPVCYVPANYGNKFVGEGVCCVTGCERSHFVGGTDEKGRPKRKFEVLHECLAACFEANQLAKQRGETL